MSRLRLVTLATLTPGAELELVARHGGTDRLAEQPGLHAVRAERVDQGLPASLDLGLVDGLLRERMRYCAGGSTHWPRLRAWPSSSSDCSTNPGSSAPGRRQWAGHSGLRGLEESSQSSSSSASYSVGGGGLAARPGDRSSASTCCRTPCAPGDRSALPRLRRPAMCATPATAATHRSATARPQRQPRRTPRSHRRRRASCAAARRPARRSTRRPCPACRSGP